MAYIGNKPEVGNFRKCDAITTSATATYNLLVGGVAVNPAQNQVICSLNGVIQSSGDSFTIASSQITFASTLASSDVIDFILILGDTLDAGVPSDDTVGLAQFSATGSPSSSNFLRGDNSWASAGASLTGSTNNQVTTVTGANAIQGETKLTFDGSLLSNTGEVAGGFNTILHNDNGTAKGLQVKIKANDGGNENNEAFDITTWDTGTTYTSKLRVNRNGDLLIGCASQGNTNAYFDVNTDDRNVLNLGTSTTSTRGLIDFRNSNGVVGYVEVSGSSTTYSTSSDYRLKENETPIVDGIERLKQLKPYKFNFKADENKIVDGFFAHEVSSIVPEAISGEKDETETYKDKDGNEQTRIKPQGIDQSKLVPLLTGALQEAITKIETLETENTDIKARLTALENA